MLVAVAHVPVLDTAAAAAAAAVVHALALAPAPAALLAVHSTAPDLAMH